MRDSELGLATGEHLIKSQNPKGELVAYAYYSTDIPVDSLNG